MHDNRLPCRPHTFVVFEKKFHDETFDRSTINLRSEDAHECAFNGANWATCDIFAAVQTANLVSTGCGNTIDTLVKANNALKKRDNKGE
jgi:hypothetical protein